MVKHLVACLALALVACQPLYGGKAEKLHNPEKHKRPPEAEAPPPEIKYVEDCNADFRDDPKKVHAQTPMSRQLTDAGDSAMQQAEKEKNDQKKVDLIREAIAGHQALVLKPALGGALLVSAAVPWLRSMASFVRRAI